MIPILDCNHARAKGSDIKCPDCGLTNNCARYAGEAESACQMCHGSCPHAAALARGADPLAGIPEPDRSRIVVDAHNAYRGAFTDANNRRLDCPEGHGERARLAAIAAGAAAYRAEHPEAHAEPHDTLPPPSDDPRRADAEGLRQAYERGRREAVEEAATYLRTFGGTATSCAKLIELQEAELAAERARAAGAEGGR